MKLKLMITTDFILRIARSVCFLYLCCFLSLLSLSDNKFFNAYFNHTLWLTGLLTIYITYYFVHQYTRKLILNNTAFMIKHKYISKHFIYKARKVHPILLYVRCTIELVLCLFAVIALFNQITLIFRIESVKDVSIHSFGYNYFFGTFMGNPFIYFILPFWWIHEYTVHHFNSYKDFFNKTKYGRFLLKYYNECKQFNWLKTYRSLPKNVQVMKYHYWLLSLNIIIEFVSLVLFFVVGIYHIWLCVRYELISFNAFKYLLAYSLCYRINLHFVHYYQNSFLIDQHFKKLKNYYLNGFNTLISLKHNKWIRKFVQY